MQNYQSMYPQDQSPQQRRTERPYNDDPREQQGQPSYQQEQCHEHTYEEGYQGYRPSYTQGEKLRPRPPSTMQGWQIVLLVAVIILVTSGGGALGSFFGSLLALAGGGLGLVVAALVVLALVSTRSVALPTRTFAISEHARLTIRSDACNVRIMRGDSRQVEVRGSYYVSRLAGEGAISPVRYMQDGDNIDINVRLWRPLHFFTIGYATLDILVPANSDVQMQNNAGTIDISGVSGLVNARTNAGTVTVASAHLGAGSSLHTNAGTITIRNSTINANTSAHTNAGTITILQSSLKGSASFTTNAGTIRFEGSLAPTGDYLFKTNAGTVDVVLPPDSSFQLNAHTNAGVVRNEFSDTPSHDGPRARLNLRSNAGNVTVWRQ